MIVEKVVICIVAEQPRFTFCSELFSVMFQLTILPYNLQNDFIPMEFYSWLLFSYF